MLASEVGDVTMRLWVGGALISNDKNAKKKKHKRQKKIEKEKKIIKKKRGTLIKKKR